MDFDTRYKNLNNAQKTAVDTIDGPVMVIAGPGTGKTELLSMRTANILRTTDTSPENILCLTFTESGASAMRARLASIIGPDAYKVAIHTFHSFGSDSINHYREYFYRGADMKPADDLTQLEILTKIFDELSYDNPLASKMNGAYTHLSDTLRSISDIKRSGLTSDELLMILDANDSVMDATESQLARIFADRISKTTATQLVPLAEIIATLPQPKLPAGMTPLASTLALSLAHVLDEASATGKTTAVTRWKNTWLEKNDRAEFIFKSRRRQAKLRAVAYIYYRYMTVMSEQSRYDYDDMILEVVHTFETQADLRYNLQEKYQYIMIDEFQDTNLAQLRLLLDIGDSPVSEGNPNILVVGDDDQAIYSFQGADVGNILQFKARFPSLTKVVLTDNYRSAACILEAAEQVVGLVQDRLTRSDESIDKKLVPHFTAKHPSVVTRQDAKPATERRETALAIKKLIDSGVDARSIAVLARTHKECSELVPYLIEENILINYERRSNVLDLEVICTLELVARVVVCIYEKRLTEVDGLLPELLSHPSFGFSAHDIWELSLAAYNDRRLWIDIMATFPSFAPLHAWLIESAGLVSTMPLEQMLDRLISSDTSENDTYSSPLKSYYFSDQKRQDTPEEYLTFLGALTTLRAHLREFSDERPRLGTLIEFIDLHHEFNRTIMNTADPSSQLEGAVHVMTAHKAKGLEFDHVFILGATDAQWGMTTRGRSPLISYPENLPLAASTGSADERMRLFFVAMTRARMSLTMSFSEANTNGKTMHIAGFLDQELFPVTHSKTPATVAQLAQELEFDWRAAHLQKPTLSMKQLLQPSLERYRLSATHINNFIDVTRGGPDGFLLQNLLHFPSAMAPSAAYGTAIHGALQTAHTHLIVNGSPQPLEDTIHDFETNLATGQLSDKDYSFFSERGSAALTKFLSSSQGSFNALARPEFDFSSQHVVFESARLTGKLDVIETDEKAKTIAVTDYKTGKPSASWAARLDYEKIKLHKYKQQLMFYRLLSENSRDFHSYTFTGGYLQFVEPNKSGEILAPLEAAFTDDEYTNFKQLVAAIWHRIINFDLPDIAEYSADYDGVVAFEAFLIDKSNEIE